MKITTKKFISGISLYCGTVIGVGLFGLPYVAARAGFFISLVYLIVIGFYSIVLALIYGEMSERTHGHHRLPGYSNLYLGKKGKIVALFSSITGIILSLLAYIVVGGSFLFELVSPLFGGTKSAYIFIFFITGALIIYGKGRALAKVEFLMLIFFGFTVILLFLKSLPYIQVSHFLTIDPKYIFLPYGVTIFSMGGAVIIPEIRDLLGKKHQGLLKNILLVGSIIVIIIYILFTFSILGLSGRETSQDALSSIQKYLHGGIGVFLFFGILTTFTSFLTVGLTLKKIFLYDLGWHKFTSWFLAMSFPILLYTFGFVNFILIISITGAIVGGVDITLMNFCYLEARKNGKVVPAYSLQLSSKIIHLTTFIFIMAIFVELWTLKNL